MKSFILASIIVVAFSACAAKEGPMGPQGSVGATGPTGATGAAGVGCVATEIDPSPAAPNGGARITCGDTSAVVLNGVNGAPGTVVEAIKLCPQAPSYPTVFVEYALCVDNDLYAVYNPSSGRDFLSFIPPGAYNSTAVGSACNFTVSGGCQISH